MSTSEAPIPKKFWAAVRWVLQNHPWIWLLAVVDRFATRDYSLAAVFGAIFVANLFVAPRWEEIGGYFQRQKAMLPYLALGALGALLLGISIGALWNGSMALAARPNTGRLVWNFDDPEKRKTDFYLVMGSINRGPLRIAGFQTIGKNVSADPVSQFKGVLRVDNTNREEPFFLLAGDADTTKLRGPFDLIVPTLPEYTYGIPGLAEFKISTFEKVFFEAGQDGLPIDQFVKEFAPFTIILEYDGLKIERHFSKKDVEDEIARFERFANPENTALSPRIVRKSDAPSAKLPSDFPPLLHQPPQQQNLTPPKQGNL